MNNVETKRFHTRMHLFTIKKIASHIYDRGLKKADYALMIYI